MNSATNPAPVPDTNGDFISRKEIARRLGGLQVGSIAKMDARGKGPPGGFHLNAVTVLYPRECFEAWLLERRQKAAQVASIPVALQKGAA
jgi:hypothetical protein